MGIRGVGRRTAAWAGALALVFCAAGEASAAPRIIRAGTSGTISVAQMVTEVREADIVFVGESHDNRAHHEAQLAVIRGLHDTGDRMAIGLEMFRASSQGALDDWVSGSTSERDFAKVFAENWTGGYWPIYRAIFVYARDAKIPMVGLNIDRGVVRQVSRHGVESLPAGSDPRYRNVSCDARDRYYRALQGLAPGHASAAEFVRFCEAQMLWDSAMAWALVDYARENPGVTTVVLAGQYHSWKHGIPDRVSHQSTLSFKVILPAGGRGPVDAGLTSKDADYVWWFGA